MDSETKNYIDMKLQKLHAAFKKELDSLRAEIAQLRANESNTNNQQLTVQAMNSITKAAANQVKLYVDQKIIPRMDNLEEHVAYHTQDTTQLISDYRREVEMESRKDRRSAPRITDGKSRGMVNNGEWLDGEVRMFYND